MQPNGGKYPGLSKEVDRSLGDVSGSTDNPLAPEVLAFDTPGRRSQKRRSKQMLMWISRVIAFGSI
jgi:hypothetical protein